MSEKEVVLAFSGGLDTSYLTVLLRDRGWNVVTANVDTGGTFVERADDIRARAESLGAKEHVFIDGRESLYERFITRVIKANYQRNGTYPSCVGIERMLQAEEITKLALERGAQAVAHGSTGAGNDHVRFDVVTHTLAPELEIITPVRDERRTREEERDFLVDRGFDVPEKNADYSFNFGLLGTYVGGKETHGSWEYLPEDAWISKSIDAAPDAGCELTISFVEGRPVRCELPDGRSVDLSVAGTPNYQILKELNDVAAEHGVGRGMLYGQTIMGNAARGGFEAGGLLTLYEAHRELERLVLTNGQLALKSQLGNQYGDMLHEARYYDPLMRNLEAFIDSTQQHVTGDVRVRLQKGNIVVLGARSPYSLLDGSSRLGALYGHSSELWTGEDARAFARIYGMPGLVTRSAQRDAEGK